MNSKQRRKKYRELAREHGFYYVIFRVSGEAIAVAQQIVNRSITFYNVQGHALLLTWGEGSFNPLGLYSCNRISEAEATTLAEFGIPLYRNSSGIIRIAGC